MMRTQTKLLSLVITLLVLTILASPASAQEIGQPVTLRAIDESSNLIPDVTFKIYRCTSSPPYSPIELVRTETSSSGELYITDLPKDYYCVEVSKTGYSQRYATEDNRFANHDDSPTLNIVMDKDLPPDDPVFEYFIEYGPYSTDDYGSGTGWYGPVYDASPQYPLTDYEIDIDLDFSGNTATVMSMGAVHITGYSGEDVIWKIPVGDTQSDYRGFRIDMYCYVGGIELCYVYGPVPPDWSGRLKFVHSSPDNWELWVDGDLLGSLTVPDIGPLTNITVGLLRRSSYPIVPGMSCDRIAIYGNVEPPPPPPTQPVEFRPFDVNGDVQLNGVQITVYTCDPVTFEPGSVVDTFTVDYGEIRSLPRGHYCIEASLNNYNQLYPISETRFSNVDGPAIALIPMERKEVIEPNQPVDFRPFDINGNVPLNGVEITVYTCDPVTFEPGSVVDIFTVDYGEIRSLPRGHYCIEASLNNYEQVYPISDTRFSNVEGPAVALIPMEREEVIGPNQPVEFRPYDPNGHTALNGVQITVYTCDPVTFEPGSVVGTFTVDYGEIRSLPRGHYCIKASLNNYKQVYPISETRFSNVDGPAFALIPMEYVGGEAGNVEVRIVDVDTEEPLHNVRLRIYEALPNFQQGRLVRDVTVSSGDYISLPAGRYFAQATKSGYTQYFEVTNTRVTVDPPFPAILYIPMTSRDGVTPGEGSFLDQSIEGIANLFGVSFEIGKTILGMLLALGIGTATAKHLRGGAQEFGFGMLGGVVLGVLIGLLPIWVLVLLILIVGLWIGKRYMDGGD